MVRDIIGLVYIGYPDEVSDTATTVNVASISTKDCVSSTCRLLMWIGSEIVDAFPLPTMFPLPTLTDENWIPGFIELWMLAMDRHGLGLWSENCSAL